MGKEIEAKFFIEEKDSMRKNLKKLQLNLIKEEFLMKRKCFHSNEAGYKWMRVRDEGDKITMTFKEITSNGINGVEEIEIEVNDFFNACELIKKTNYFEVSYQETLREIWRNNEVEIVIDTWPFLQPYIEIEAESEEIVRKYSKLLNFDFEKDASFGGVAILYNKAFGIPQKEVNDAPIVTFEEKSFEKLLNSYKK